MIDIFKLLKVETREDKYTYCLLEMINYGDSSFRKKVGNMFGFGDSSYEVVRKSFNNVVSESRKKITPDFILVNDTHVAIIESKMFSAEGYRQTLDYSSNIDIIKRELGVVGKEIGFYFLTLSGIKSESTLFTIVKWNDFYENILSETKFEDECLEVIRKTILEQARKYKKFEKALYEKQYNDMFDQNQYWVSPYSLLSSGQYDEILQQVSGEEPFIIYHFDVTGQGHSEFCTDLYKEKWRKVGNSRFDNIHLFIRIEWNNEAPIVWLSWEYYDIDHYDKNSNTAPYVQKSTPVPKKERDVIVKSLIDYKETWKRPVSREVIRITSKKEDSIKALKCIINCQNKTIADILDEIKKVVCYYTKEIEIILSSFSSSGEYLVFDKDEYLILQ